MTARILVADDSPTIQKVVGITLSNEPYILSECTDEDSLFRHLGQEEFDLILLDFNLSDEKDGYKLSAEVVKRSPNSEIMVMLGTFDTVDETRLEECGVRAKIVKPFESSRFIDLCRNLIDGNADESGEYEEEGFDSDEENNEEVDLSTDHNSQEDIGDDWVVDSPDHQEVEVTSSENQFQEEGPGDVLTSEIEGWGMEVPGVIGKQSSNDLGLFPPIIEGEERETPSVNEEYSFNLPDEIEENVRGSEPSELENISLSSKLVSLNELTLSEETEELEETRESEEERDLLSEIEDDISPDDFWAADGDEKEDSVESQLDSSEIEEASPIIEEETVLDSHAVEESEVNQVAFENSINISHDEIVDQIKSSLTPAIEELVKNYCKERVEQIAWEVIPDLAENLIRKEIQEISQSIRD